MANPSSFIPQKVGFPQAFGSTPYQHTAQFSQFGQPQAPTTNPRTNEVPRSAFQVPPTSTAPSGFPQFPTTPNYTPNTQMVNGFPQNKNVAPSAPKVDVNGPLSAFKPYDSSVSQAAPIPPFPGPSMAFQPPPNPFTSTQGFQPPVQHVATTGSLPHPPFGGSAPMVHQNSSYNSNSTLGPAGPPVPPAPPGLAGHSRSSASTPMQSAAFHPPASTPMQSSAFHPPASTPMQSAAFQPPAPPNIQQVQQGFTHMSMNAQPTVPQHVNSSWGVPHPQDSRLTTQMQTPDLIDLIAERNVLQLGFDDNEYVLPHNMANNAARVDPCVFRCTLTMVPQTEELLKKSRLPFGLTLHPFRDMKNLNIIQTSTIVRCRYCRTYINPYVYLPDSRHWKCNLCNRNNDLPDDFCWDPNTKSFGDPVNRPEIKHPTVEFIAPNEYMLRPPQPAVYVFVLDVSAAAVEAGYIYTFSEQLLINLDQLPGDERTQVAFVCVDSMVHFYQFSSGSRRLPRELIVDEVDEMFLPAHQGILIPLRKNADVVRAFVEKLPVLFEHAKSSSNCLGSALKIVHELIAEIGGRVTVFQASIPNIGPASLKPREDPNQRAADEVQNLGPVTDFYKCLALECTGHQVALDLFMLNSQYADLATLSEMAKFSTGCVYHFPNYHCLNDTVQVKRFEKILTRYLTRKIGFEAVLRIRCSRGLSLSAFYGNFFVRSTDLLALANVNPDSAIAVQVSMDEKLSTTACFQAALLYTSSKGDRRIRVHTMCLPTTADLAQVYSNFDLKATISLIAKIGVDRSMSGSSLADCREAIVNAVIDSLGAYHKTMRQGRPGGLLVPRRGHLRLFPLYALAMLKHTSFCAGRSVKLDDRVAAMLMLRFCPLEQILSEFYPQLYRLNEILQFEDGKWPSALPLSFEYVNREGIYLIEAGSAIYIYLSSHSDAQLVQDLFGCSYYQVDETSFRIYDNPFSEKVHAFVRHVTALKFYLGPVIIVKEDSAVREAILRRFIDDRTESNHSYVEFLHHIKREINN
uniref:Protein transport protein Sec24A n=1 Tax=Haemonchus contortus TaxID=6289 RepID=A0A7I4YP46_HAECO